MQICDNKITSARKDVSASRAPRISLKLNVFPTGYSEPGNDSVIVTADYPSLQQSFDDSSTDVPESFGMRPRPILPRGRAAQGGGVRQHPQHRPLFPFAHSSFSLRNQSYARGFPCTEKIRPGAQK